jgi:hypothetical protein
VYAFNTSGNAGAGGAQKVSSKLISARFSLEVFLSQSFLSEPFFPELRFLSVPAQGL